MSTHEVSLKAASGPPPLLWVNHNAKHRKAQPHRHAVFSHVQNSYKRWKRQEDAKSLRKAARIPGLSSVQLQKLDTEKHSDLAQKSKTLIVEHDQRRHFCTHHTTKEQATRNCIRCTTAQINLQTILAMGNSDPFHVFAIPIDAKVARVMTYTSDLYLPGIYKHHKLSDRKTASIQAFNEIVAFLHDECTAYPHLARIAAVMPKSSVESSSVSESVNYKTKGIVALRKRLICPSSLLDPKTPAAVLLFLTAELYDGNLEAALFHARILAHVLENGTFAIDFWFLFKSLYHDVQRACLSLVRPAFDLDAWLPQQFASLSLAKTPLMPDDTAHESHGLVDVSIRNSSITPLILEARYCKDLSLRILQDGTLANNQINWYLGCRTMACVGRTINHYLDSRLSMKKQEIFDCVSLAEARVEAYLSLALLYILRCEAKMDIFQIGEKDAIFRANPLVLERMKGLLELDRKAQTSRAKLFALFVGAYAEQASEATPPGAPERSWFNVNLAIESATLGLWSWEEVREVLLGFHYSDTLQPHGSTWFWKTMRVNSKQRPSSTFQAVERTHDNQ